MNRIDSLFSQSAPQGRKAFVAYIVAGDPDLDATVELAAALGDAGVDLLELGIPFSDPLADGVVNQLASQRALDSGTTLAGIFKAVAAIRRRTQIPIVFFTYYNPVFRYGVEAFLAESQKSGVDGLLILDLPPEEAGKAWEAYPDLRRISLIAPTTTGDRIRSIASGSSGFIYYVSREGVTGMQQQVSADLSNRMAAIRAATSLPVCVGFGVSNSEQARQVAGAAEGVVVGSAIVQKIGQYGKDPDLVPKVSAFVRELATAVHSI